MLTKEKLIALATAEGAKFPELVYAQWAVDSNRGQIVYGVNNYFGIPGKGTKRVTKKIINGKEVTVTEEFEDFTSEAEGVRRLVDLWYENNGLRQGVNTAETVEEAAQKLYTLKYTLDPAYAAKLLVVINEDDDGGGGGDDDGGGGDDDCEGDDCSVSEEDLKESLDPIIDQLDRIEAKVNAIFNLVNNT